jgi:hypothetical protein
MPPEDIQALVNQGVKPEEMGLPAIEEEAEAIVDIVEQPMSPLPPRKRKLEVDGSEEADNPSNEVIEMGGGSGQATIDGSGEAVGASSSVNNQHVNNISNLTSCSSSKKIRKVQTKARSSASGIGKTRGKLQDSK